jgi:dihydropteroate synthase
MQNDECRMTKDEAPLNDGTDLLIRHSSLGIRHSKPVSWSIRGIDINLTARGLVMGVLNVTPDSFSDGGNYFDVKAAVAHGLEMVAAGADILDVGGESTRPGAEPVALVDELARVIPVITQLRAQSSAFISVDTMKAEVARCAVKAGADIINDIAGFRDEAMIEVAIQSAAALIIMHMKGTPQTMQQNPVYEDVTGEVMAFFAQRNEELQQRGIAGERIAFDPGFGFGKTLEHNLALLKALPDLCARGRPLVVGVSRKSMIARLLDDHRMENRDWPTVALTAWMRDAGANVVRVHDVKPNVEAMRMTEAVMGQGTRHSPLRPSTL